MTNPITHVISDGESLAYIVRAQFATDETTFITPADASMQVGFVVYPAKGVVRRHFHRPTERILKTTSEAIYVRDGSCEIDVYNSENRLVATEILNPGDIVLILAGGHEFRFVEDSVLLEVKQGPYTGVDEKEFF